MTDIPTPPTSGQDPYSDPVIAGLEQALSGAAPAGSARPAQLGWGIPIQTVPTVPGPLPLPHGLHLVIGKKAIGKTVNTLALACWMQASGCPAYFDTVMEPRSRYPISATATPEKWQDLLLSFFKKAAGGVVVVDSLTYLISRLPAVAALGDYLSKVTYAGGLSPRDIAGVQAHDQLARKHGVALIGIMNAELFPVVDKFEAACEGALNVRALGLLDQRDRRVRQIRDISIPRPFVNEALISLGYSPVQGEGAYSYGNRA